MRFLLILLSLTAFAQPMARWTFDSVATNSGTQSGLGASYTGSPTYAAARIGNGLVLNGTTQWATVTAASAINSLPTANFTVTAWVYLADCNTRQLAGKTNSGAQGWQIYASNGYCDPRIDVQFPTTTATFQTARYAFSAATWNHLAYVWTASTKRARLYINGLEAPLVTQIAGSGTYAGDSSFNLVLGGTTDNASFKDLDTNLMGTPLLSGKLDDVRIYTSALTRRQVRIAMGDVPTSTTPVTIYRYSTNFYGLRVQMTGGTAPDGEYAEFVLAKLAVSNGSVWAIQGLRIVDPDTTAHPVYELADGTSVWEFAFQVGVTADTVDKYAYQGGGHGLTSLTSWTLTLDSADMTGLAAGDFRAGSTAVSTQGLNLYIYDGVTQCGTGTLTHTFTSSGMQIDHTHAFSAGYSIMNSYAHMLPLTSGRGNMQYAHIGTNTPDVGPFAYGIPAPVAYYTTGAAQTSGYFYGAIPYRVTLTLPSGGPDYPAGSWANATSEKWWLNDTTGYAKQYVNLVSGGYGARITAPASTASRAVYSVTRTN